DDLELIVPGHFDDPAVRGGAAVAALLRVRRGGGQEPEGELGAREHREGLDPEYLHRRSSSGGKTSWAAAMSRGPLDFKTAAASPGAPPRGAGIRHFNRTSCRGTTSVHRRQAPSP